MLCEECLSCLRCFDGEEKMRRDRNEFLGN